MKKRAPLEYIPYKDNPNVFVEYSLKFKNDLIEPGDKIKIKFDRDTYKFLRLAHHIVNDNTWIDCISISRGSWHSFRVDQLARKVKPKRPRAKKIDNN